MTSAINESRIALVRHGPSAHVHAGWVDAHGFRAWRVAYEAAAIDERLIPLAPLVDAAASANLVLASDAPRAVASARLLAAGRDVVLSPLLRELDLEAPSFGKLRLPLPAWALAVVGRTLVQTLRRRYPSPAEGARLDEAAEWLRQLAAEHQTIVVVTHAMFRKRLAARLTKRGWRFEPGRRTLQPWSAWGLRQASESQRRSAGGSLSRGYWANSS